jgi:hypothetical protein
LKKYSLELAESPLTVVANEVLEVNVVFEIAQSSWKTVLVRMQFGLPGTESVRGGIYAPARIIQTIHSLSPYRSSQ